MIDKKIATMNIGEKLQELVLNGYEIKQFTEEIKEKLRKCTNLSSLHLNGCQIESLQDFPSLPKLIKLEMSGNMFKGSELKILANCASNIQELYINNNEIKDYDEIASLGQLKNLKTLHLIGCEICAKADYREKIFSLIPSLQMLDFVKKEEKKVSQTDLHYGNLFKDNNQVEEKEELACSLHYNAPFILYCGDASCHKFKLCEFCCTTHEHPQQKRISVTTVKTKFYEQLTGQVIEEYENLEQSNKTKIEEFTQKFNEYYVGLEKKLLDFLASFKEKLFSTHKEIVQNILKENKSSQTLWKNHKDSFENLKLNSDQPVESKLKEYLGYALRVKQDLSDKEISQGLFLKSMKESEDSIFKTIEKQFQRIFDTFSNPLDNKENKSEDNFPKGAPLFGDLFKRAPLFAASNQKLPGELKQEKSKIEEKMEESKSSQREIRTIFGIKIDNKGVNQEPSNPFLAISESTNLFRRAVEKVDVSSQTDVENSGNLSDSKNVEIKNIITNLISLEPNLKKIMDNKKEWKSTCSAYHTSSTYYHVGPRYWVADLVTSMYDIFEQIGSYIAKLHSIHQEKYEDKTLGDPSVKKTDSFLEKFA